MRRMRQETAVREVRFRLGETMADGTRRFAQRVNIFGMPEKKVPLGTNWRLAGWRVDIDPKTGEEFLVLRFENTSVLQADGVGSTGGRHKPKAKSNEPAPADSGGDDPATNEPTDTDLAPPEPETGTERRDAAPAEPAGASPSGAS